MNYFSDIFNEIYQGSQKYFHYDPDQYYNNNI